MEMGWERSRIVRDGNASLWCLVVLVLGSRGLVKLWEFLYIF